MPTTKKEPSNPNKGSVQNWVTHSPQFHAIFDHNPDAVIVFDSQGYYLNANKAALKLFGVKKKDFLGQHYTKYFDPKRRKQAESGHRAFLLAGSGRAETEIISADGKRRWVAYNAVANVMPDIHVCFIRDITVLKEADSFQRQNHTKLLTLVHERTKELRESNKALKKEILVRKKTEEQLEYQSGKVERQKDRLLAIFNNVEEGVFILDDKKRITLANISCLKMTGNTLEQIKSKKYYNVFKCQDKNGRKYPDFDATAQVIATKKPVLYNEHIHENQFGEKRWVGVSQTPILNSKKEVHQVVGVIRDITAYKELEKAKSEFVSVASHELRTPLTVINGYLSLILNGDLGTLDQEAGRDNFLLILQKVFKETRRLTKLAEELLNVSRIEGGKVKLHITRVSLAEVVSDVLVELHGLADEKNIKLKIKPSLLNGKDCLVYADRDKLKQILVNLIENAIKYTETRGEVAVNYFAQDDIVTTQIMDTGAGIPATILPRIFEKFQQGSSAYLKENKGTGLGLFIVKSLIELQHGNIWVKSKLGEGSTFTFTLPSGFTKTMLV